MPFIFFVGCGGKEEKKEEIIRPVRYQKVLLEGGKRTHAFSGVARAGIETHLSFKVAGTVQRVNEKVGKNVKAGALLASLDPSDYVLQFEEADAAVKNADAQEKNAKSNYERIQVLYENQNASLSDFESARTAFESAKANEKAVKQRRKLAELQLSYTKLYAPIDGVIADVNMEENENVRPGQTVFLLNSGADLEVEVAVVETYISKIKEGDKALVKFSAIPDKQYNGVVTEVAFAIGRAETTYPVSVKITDQDDQIRPGMAVDVTFTFDYENENNNVVVPSIAIVEDRDGRFVFVAEPEKSNGNFGIIKKKNVETGKLRPEGMEISQGLAEGDLVVTAGISKIKEGMKVKLIQ